MIREFRIFGIERRNDEQGYQTAGGEENVESTTDNECELSGAVIEVIDASNVS
jgi:hypothetical protein